MLHRLKEWDEQLLLFLNQFHAPWLDPVMMLVTKTEFWAPLYIFLLYLIFRNYKKEGWLILASVAVTILLADQISYNIIKPLFHRLRPSNEPALEGIVHIVNGYHGGRYGFVSNHAANTTGVALFIYFLFKNKYSWTWLIFIWPIIMSYTRIYLGVHYPGDVIGGAAVGLLCGYGGYRFYRWLKSRIMNKNDGLRVSGRE